MKTEPKYLTVGELVDLRRTEIARANPEYQRGVMWNRDQQKKLIDSVMRDYQLPVIYLHYNEIAVADMRRESFDIIDGQQRIEALYLFVEGAFPLYQVDDEGARFPEFLREDPCPWGGKDFHGLSDELRTKLLESQIPVSVIKTDNSNEVRDLFVRLQAGLPLNAQEKRDSFPGQFTDFILSLGGKPAIAKYPGHPFFQKILKMKPGRDRGKTRQLAAQIASLYLERRSRGTRHFVDINARAIDDYYYSNLDFNSESDDCKRLRAILDELTHLFAQWRGPKLKAHDAMHLVLLLDSLWDDYTKSWEATLEPAQREFSATLVQAAKSARDGDPDETWSRYGVWTRSNSDRGENIERRHRYYSQRMHEFMGNVVLKDQRRAFGPLEREIIFWRDGDCQVCQAPVLWDEAEIHHLVPHAQGGMTELKNGALVHKHCHPKSEHEVVSLRKKVLGAVGDDGTIDESEPDFTNLATAFFDDSEPTSETVISFDEDNPDE